MKLIHGRAAREGRLNKTGMAWDGQIKPVLDEWGDPVGSEFTRKKCIYCGGEVRFSAGGVLNCQSCGTVYNQGKPYPEKRKSPDQARKWGADRFMARYYKAGI